MASLWLFLENEYKKICVTLTKSNLKRKKKIFIAPAALLL